MPYPNLRKDARDFQWWLGRMARIADQDSDIADRESCPCLEFYLINDVARLLHEAESRVSMLRKLQEESK